MDIATAASRILMCSCLVLGVGAEGWSDVASNPELCTLIVYRDVFQHELTDWPDAGLKPRSPRYVFGINDPITVEVRFQQQVSSPVTVEVIDTTTFEEHDVDCDFYQRSGGWFVYRLRPTEYIYLVGDRPANPRGTTFQVAGEEVLNFTVAIMRDCKQNWMVDRGERASGGAVFYGGASGDRTVCRFPQWHENGDHDFGDILSPVDIAAFRDFVNRAGNDPPGGGQADILHISSHGGFDGSLLDDAGHVLFNPIDHGRAWNSDVEYVVLAACNTLNNSALDVTGFEAWSTMIRGPHGAHGIFGAHHPLGGDLTSQFSRFYAELASGGTYMTSYIDGMTLAGAPQPWAILINPDDLADTLKEVRQDGGEGLRLFQSP